MIATAIVIVVACTLALAVTGGFLIYLGLCGRRGILWTMRMKMDD